jgi:cation:H+ antiporter
MPGDAALLGWIALVVAGIAAMQWGAARAAGALDAYRDAAGLRGAVAGTLLGVATATPEISVNVASVAFGWPDLGLGAALGSNVPALPLVFALAWLSLRTAPRPPPVPDGGRTPLVKAAAAPIQAVPYLAVVLLLALLTLPPRWAGLQPVDGAILVAAWILYAAHALAQPRRRPTAPAAAVPRALRAGVLALPAIAVGALAAVVAARRLGEAFGASDLVVGLFVIGLLCALPESFAAWRLAREGKTTTAVATAMADGIASLTLALVAPAIAGAGVGNVALYVLNLALLVFVLLAYLALNRRAEGGRLEGARVALFLGAYALYLAATAWLLVHAAPAARGG